MLEAIGSGPGPGTGSGTGYGPGTGTAAVLGRVRASLGVAELVRQVTEVLAQRFSVCSVRGEVSGFSRAASGHCYFTLKDADGGAALVRCAMFRRAASLMSFLPADGQLVEVRGRLGVYEPRGELQLVVESMQRAGAGALFEQFMRTKLRLEAEGLFDAAAKRMPAAHPRAIGLVTSLDGAVLHDVVTTLLRRAPHVAVVVYPSRVQGPGAPACLRAAIEAAGARAEVDTLIVCRGGGSLEDLWAFNDEQVVRAVVAARMPVISGVGHETDVTLVDFAADLRAATPTAAAELAATPAQACWQVLAQAANRLRRPLRDRLDSAAQRLDRVSLRLVAPAQRLRQQAQRLDHLQERQRAGVWRTIGARHLAHPGREAHLRRAVAAQVLSRRQRLLHLEARLRALDPAQVLARGYAWLADASDRPVMSIRQMTVGQRLSAVLVDGTVPIRIEAVDAGSVDGEAVDAGLVDAEAVDAGSVNREAVNREAVDGEAVEGPSGDVASINARSAVGGDVPGRPAALGPGAR